VYRYPRFAFRWKENLYCASGSKRSSKIMRLDAVAGELINLLLPLRSTLCRYPAGPGPGDPVFVFVSYRPWHFLLFSKEKKGGKMYVILHFSHRCLLLGLNVPLYAERFGLGEWKWEGSCSLTLSKDILLGVVDFTTTLENY